MISAPLSSSVKCWSPFFLKYSSLHLDQCTPLAVLFALLVSSMKFPLTYNSDKSFLFNFSSSWHQTVLNQVIGSGFPRLFLEHSPFMRGWHIARWQYSSLGEGAAVVSLRAVDMGEEVLVRVQVG